MSRCLCEASKHAELLRIRHLASLLTCRVSLGCVTRRPGLSVRIDPRAYFAVSGLKHLPACYVDESPFAKLRHDDRAAGDQYASSVGQCR